VEHRASAGVWGDVAPAGGGRDSESTGDDGNSNESRTRPVSVEAEPDRRGGIQSAARMSLAAGPVRRRRMSLPVHRYTAA